MTSFVIILVAIAAMLPMLSLLRKRMAGQPAMQSTRGALLAVIIILILLGAVLLFFLLSGRAA